MIKKIIFIFGIALLVGFAPHAAADDDTSGNLPDYSAHGIFDGYPGVSDDYTPWFEIENPGFNIYDDGVLPWHYEYGINLGTDDLGFAGESIGAVDGLGGAVDFRLNGLELTGAETYGNWIADPTNPDSEGFYCIICYGFQTTVGGHDLTTTLNVFSNAMPQLEVDLDGKDVFGDALSNGAGPASALDPQWWFTPEDFPNLDLPDIFGLG
jgi:hypothetical protein